MIKLFCAVLFALVCAGCAVPAGYYRYPPLDCGRYTRQHEAEAIAKHHIQKTLIYRAPQYRFERIYCGRQYNHDPFADGNKVHDGYILPVHINAQTVFGKKYKTSWLLVIRDGQVVYRTRKQ